jgi:putative ABC transport system permease protein
MKFFLLVWAALIRKPARAVLTLLSVTVAFMLVGLMIGLNASFEHIVELARADRIFVDPRFGGKLPLAMARQISDRKGVAHVAAVGVVFGYYQDPKNKVAVMFGDDARRYTRAEWPVTAQQWDLLRDNRNGVLMSELQAARWHKKAGDNFVIQAPSLNRIDGTKFWTFKVLAVTADVPAWTSGYIEGNYDYYDKSLPLAEQGKVTYLEVLAVDPEEGPQIARGIERHYANSSTPTLSFTEKQGFAGGMAGGLNVATVTQDISLAGLLMILFLTANVIAQSVRERIPEFAALKSIGFTDSIVIQLVFMEAAVPCVIGSALGMVLAACLAAQVPRICPPGWSLPAPAMAPVVYVAAVLGAAVIAFASAVLPAMRLKQMDIATALSKR